MISDFFSMHSFHTGQSTIDENVCVYVLQRRSIVVLFKRL